MPLKWKTLASVLLFGLMLILSCYHLLTKSLQRVILAALLCLKCQASLLVPAPAVGGSIPSPCGLLFLLCVLSHTFLPLLLPEIMCFRMARNLLLKITRNDCAFV